MSVDKQLEELYYHILKEGVAKNDRTETGTLSVFGYDKPIVIDNIMEDFPATKRKALAWKAMVSELIWFLGGHTNVNVLRYIQHGDYHSTKKTIWDDNYLNEGKALGYSNGEMGPIYGFHMHKQLKEVMHQISVNPDSRRLVMSNWQFDDLESMTLPPCHGIHTQFYVVNGKLNLNTTMRSTDAFLGLPFNIASYSLMLALVATMLGLEVGTMKLYLVGDVHIYLNHLDQVKEFLGREDIDKPAKLVIPEDICLMNFRTLDIKLEHIYLEGYEHQGRISAPMAYKKN